MTIAHFGITIHFEKHRNKNTFKKINIIALLISSFGLNGFMFHVLFAFNGSLLRRSINFVGTAVNNLPGVY